MYLAGNHNCMIHFRLDKWIMMFVSFWQYFPYYHQRNECSFNDTGVKKMKWFLSLTRCHFQPPVTKGYKWLEMAPRE